MSSTDLYAGVVSPSASNRASDASHAALPPRGDPRFLIPRYPAAAAAAALREYSLPQRRFARVLKAMGGAAALIGGARLLPTKIELGGEGTFLDYLSHYFDEKHLIYSVHLGPPRANRKPVIHVMTASGASIAYVKLGINEYTSKRISAEATALDRVGAAEMTNLLTPSLMHSGSWNGNSFLIMESLPRRRNRIPSRGYRLSALSALENAFPVENQQFFSTRYWESVLEDLRNLPSSPQKERMYRVFSHLSDRYQDASFSIGASHGDWSPWNIGRRGDCVLAWDWERFSTGTPLGWDEIHFRLGNHPGGPAHAMRDHRSLLAHLSRRSQASPPVLLATYLVCRGVARLRGKRETGIESNSLATWLLPGLEDLVFQRMEGTSRGN